MHGDSSYRTMSWFLKGWHSVMVQCQWQWTINLKKNNIWLWLWLLSKRQVIYVRLVFFFFCYCRFPHNGHNSFDSRRPNRNCVYHCIVCLKTSSLFAYGKSVKSSESLARRNVTCSFNNAYANITRILHLFTYNRFLFVWNIFRVAWASQGKRKKLALSYNFTFC